MRTAKCGHACPSHPGPMRKECEGCRPGQVWNYREGKCALAKCGHSVPFSPNGRNACDACQQRRDPRTCKSCGKDITQRRRNVIYCDQLCAGVFYGQRLAEPLPPRVCALPTCGRTFQPKSKRQRCCSEQHGKNLYNIQSRADGRQAPEPWNDRRRDNYHRRRALKKGASTGEPVKLADIAARDKGCCHLCGKRVPDKAWPHPLSPSLDHVIPLTKGGAHDPSNVRLAHLRCNTAKGNREAGEQLLLIG